MISYTLSEVAEMLKITRQKVHAWVKQPNGLRAVNVATDANGERPRYRVTHTELERFLKSRTKARVKG